MRYFLVLVWLTSGISVFSQESASDAPKATKDTVNPYDINVPITSDTGPSYGSGLQQVSREIASNPSLIALAQETGISGTVQISFRIEPDGKTSAINVLNGPDDKINKQAATLLKAKTFEPEKQNGIPTSCMLVIGIPVSGR